MLIGIWIKNADNRKLLLFLDASHLYSLQTKLNLTRQILKELDYPIEVSNGFDGYTGYF